MAVGISPSQLANLLTRLAPRVRRGRQGLGREIEIDVVQRIDLVVAFGRIGIPAAQAFEMAEALQQSGMAAITPYMQVAYDRDSHLNDLRSRLLEAAEQVIARPRGRPRNVA